jgi:diguanylate cyclase (GGDEF)-like protein
MNKKTENLLRKKLNLEKDVNDRVQEIREVFFSDAPEDLKMESVHAILSELAEKVVDARLSAMFESRTGLFSPKAGEEFLDRDLSLARRQKKPIGIILADIDYLKEINDKFGHIVGTKIIVEVAQTIKKVIRRSDMAARYGGDEFLIVLSGSDECRTNEVGERLRKAISKIEVDGAKVSMSLGALCINPENNLTPEQAIEKADQILYAQKAKRINVNA